MKTKKRSGRPSRQLVPGERVPMSFRVRPELKGKMDGAAENSGRSVAQEIELRLENSFRDENYADQAMELAYGQQPAALLATIARVMDYVGRHAGFRATGTIEGAAEWFEDAAAFDQVAQGICEVLSAFQP